MRLIQDDSVGELCQGAGSCNPIVPMLLAGLVVSREQPHHLRGFSDVRVGGQRLRDMVADGRCTWRLTLFLLLIGEVENRCCTMNAWRCYDAERNKQAHQPHGETEAYGRRNS